jgi:hypothetical protein
MSERDLTLRHFAADMAAEVTDIQRSKLLRTIRDLLFRPGLLTLENFTGRRVRYLKPITLTLAVFALHLFAFTASDAPMFDVRRLAPEAQRSTPGSVPARLWTAMERRAQADGVTADTVADRINDRWVRNYSLLQIPLIALLAAWIRLILHFSRRHFVEHLVFGMHLISFTGFTVVLMWPLLYLAEPVPSAALGLVAGKFLFDWCWVSLAVRRVYGRGMAKAWLLGLLVQGGYFFAFNLVSQLGLAQAMRSVLAG